MLLDDIVAKLEAALGDRVDASSAQPPAQASEDRHVVTDGERKSLGRSARSARHGARPAGEPIYRDDSYCDHYTPTKSPGCLAKLLA